MSLNKWNLKLKIHFCRAFQRNYLCFPKKIQILFITNQSTSQIKADTSYKIGFTYLNDSDKYGQYITMYEENNSLLIYVQLLSAKNEHWLISMDNILQCMKRIILYLHMSNCCRRKMNIRREICNVYYWVCIQWHQYVLTSLQINIF